jgi:uncharacterized protein YndB with AHSA1/START domain
MSPIPTGRLVPTAEGRDLVLTRTFPAGIEDVWASITESERTARWFAGWEGEAKPGATITVTMGFEDDAPRSEMLIEACEAPRHLAVRSEDEYGSWHLEAHLAEQAGVTTLTLTQHLADDAAPGEVGPGWEYYLDMLVASRAEQDTGTAAPTPDFDDYYPAQKAYYEGL